jgi:hypothetical protein
MKNTRTYKIPHIAEVRGDWRKEAAPAAVDNFPWGGEAAAYGGLVDYRPLTTARLAADDDSLFVFMETDETDLRSETKGFGSVYTDSCMEFFLLPDPDNSPRYLNWEFNPAGGMYLSIGTCRDDRATTAQENYRELFKVKTAVHTKGWNLEYQIPLSFLRGFFPLLELKTGRVMRGNFYKCGDKTVHPHFGCWSPIDLPKPDFHCPDFFGTLVL